VTKTLEANDHLRALNDDEFDLVAGGAYKQLFNIMVGGMHVWSWVMDGYVNTCVTVKGNGTCKISPIK
jgi:hypothetical protein